MMKDPNFAANHILNLLGIVNVDDLLLLDEIVYARGAVIRECQMEGAEARILLGPGKPIISVSSSTSIYPTRRRFSIAHELGHLEMHRRTNLLKSCSSLDIQEGPKNVLNNIEQEANQFASAFLMPDRFVKEPFEKCEPNFEIISAWANKLETSLTATAIKFTQYTFEPVAVVYSYKRVIQYFIPSSEFKELGVFPDVKNFVKENTIAKKNFDGYDSLQMWYDIKASNWFRPDNNAFDRNDTIKEWSIAMPNFDAVLTLLWVDRPLGLNY